MDAGLALLVACVKSDCLLGEKLAAALSHGFKVPILEGVDKPIQFRYFKGAREFDEKVPSVTAIYFCAKYLSVNFRCEGVDYGVRLSTIKARRFDQPER